MNKIILMATVVLLSGCIKSTEKPKVSTFNLKQDPSISGDFGTQSQYSSFDKVFVIVKEDEENESEVSQVAIESVNDGGGFKVISKNGCDKTLVKREKCFVRVRYLGKEYKSSTSGLKTANLKIGSLTIALSVNFQKENPSAELETIINGSSVEETTDAYCLTDSCYITFQYKNIGSFPHTPSSLQVPTGYIVTYNSCGRSLAPGKSCFIRLKVQEANDLSSGEVVLNVNGQEISRTIRVVKEVDDSSPLISSFVTNAQEVSGDLFVKDAVANISVAISENRPERGVKIKWSTDSDCGNGSWEDAASLNFVKNITLLSNQVNSVSLKAKDAIGNESGCVSYSITHDNLSPNLSTALNLEDIRVSSLPLSLSFTESSFFSFKLVEGSSCSIGSYQEVGLVDSYNSPLSLSSTNDVLYSLCLKLVDKAGNEFLISDSFLICKDGEKQIRNGECTHRVIQSYSGYKAYSDDSYAESCLSYKTTNDGYRKYEGATGSGVYKLKVGADSFTAYCDMDSSDGPWMLVMTTSATSAYKYSNAVWSSVTTTAEPLPTTDADRVSKAFYYAPNNFAKVCLRNSSGSFVCENILSKKDTPLNLATSSEPILTGPLINVTSSNWKSITPSSVWNANFHTRWGWNQVGGTHGKLRVGLSADVDYSDNSDSFIGIGWGDGAAVDASKCAMESSYGSGYCQHSGLTTPSPKSAGRAGQIWVKSVPLLQTCSDVQSTYKSVMMLSSSEVTLDVNAALAGGESTHFCEFNTYGGGWTRISSGKYNGNGAVTIDDKNLIYNKMWINKSDLDSTINDYATPVGDSVWEWSGWALSRNSFKLDSINRVFNAVSDLEYETTMMGSEVFSNLSSNLLSRSSPTSLCLQNTTSKAFSINTCVKNVLVSIPTANRISNLHHVEVTGANNNLQQSYNVFVKQDVSTTTYVGSCKALLQQDKGLYGKDGLYQIQISGESSPITVYCDMTTDGGGWTAIESFSLANNGIYYQKGFMESLERNATITQGSKFPYTDYRLSLLRMRALCNNNTTCDWYSRIRYSAEQNESWLIVRSNNLTSGSWVGSNVSMEGKIRGNNLSLASRAFWNQAGVYHPHTDAPAIGVPNSVASEDVFGYYQSVNANFINANAPDIGSNITMWFIK